MNEPCIERIWSGWPKGRECGANARYLAKAPGDMLWTPLCGRHANTGRWARYPDSTWQDMPKPKRTRVRPVARARET